MNEFIDKFQHQIGAVHFVKEIIDFGNQGVVEGGKHIRLAREFVPARLLVEVIGQFDNHLFEGEILGNILEVTITHEIDGSKTTATDLLDQAIAPKQQER